MCLDDYLKKAIELITKVSVITIKYPVIFCFSPIVLLQKDILLHFFKNSC